MDPFVTLAISLGLGLLVGLERQRIESHLGGIRTFPLISMFGTFCGFLSAGRGAWIIAAGFIAVFGVLAISNIIRLREEGAEPGQTTEVAALLTFALGAYLVEGNRSVAIVATGVLVVLLHLKGPMHYFVTCMGKQDMTGMIQLVVISLIILPLLPDRAYGPFKVLNPYDIWRMVVLIVGISMAGYVAYKLMGKQVGTLLGGIFGGLISSTATTVSYARRTRSAPEAAKLAVLAILLASAIAYLRVLFEVVVVAPQNVRALILPLVALFLWSCVVAAGAYFMYREDDNEIPTPENPAELKSALVFGAIYALVLFAVAAAKQHFGSSGLYIVSIISGLTDMDAITLSVSRMVEEGRIKADSGWRYILVASLSNLVFKGVAAGFLGGWRLALRLGVFFGVIMAGGIVVLLFWPESWTLSAIPLMTGQDAAN